MAAAREDEARTGLGRTEGAPAVEINRGYLPPAEHVPPPEPTRLAKFGERVAPRQARADAARVLLFPALLAGAAVMLLVLETSVRVRRLRVDGLHAGAAARVGEFLRQYPLHLYPVLAKAFELAYLDEELSALIHDGEPVLELAIGEGSLSKRVFPAGTKVVGLDISPYSLRFAAPLEHVEQAVIADCLNPPVEPGSFGLLVSNNFLHHVTRKRETLERWAALSRVAILNENPRAWATGWTMPYLLRRIGLTRRADAVANEIELSHLQSLATSDELDELVAQDFHVRRRASYLSERSFFRCSLLSFLMRATGPPTPPIVKRLLNGPFAFIARPLTSRLAYLLIVTDQQHDRQNDAFVSYTLESRHRTEHATRPGTLVCADCSGSLDGNRCGSCGREFVLLDGMLFLLPRELDHIARDYDSAYPQDAEHL